jgi:hypothetical protein
MSKRLDGSKLNLFDIEMRCANKKTYMLRLILSIFYEKCWYSTVDGRAFNGLVVLTSLS